MTVREHGWLTLSSRLIRGLLLVVGLVVLGVALLVAFVPETEQLLPVEEAILRLGSDYLVVAVVGVLAVGLSMLAVATRHLRGVEEATPPVVEGVQSASYPGVEFDRAVGGSLGGWFDRSFDVDRRDRLREATTRAIMHADSCSRTVAERRIAEGNWSSDPVAARYLSDRPHGWWSGRTMRSDAAVRRTVDAIAQLTDDEEASKRADERHEGREGITQ